MTERKNIIFMEVPDISQKKNKLEKMVNSYQYIIYFPGKKVLKKF